MHTPGSKVCESTDSHTAHKHTVSEIKHSHLQVLRRAAIPGTEYMQSGNPENKKAGVSAYMPTGSSWAYQPGHEPKH